MIGQQQIAFVTRQAFDLFGTNIQKHLLSGRGDDLYRPVTQHESTLNVRGGLRHDRFHYAHRIFSRRAAGVAGTVIMVVSVYAAYIPVNLDPVWPVFDKSSRPCTMEDRALADVSSDLPAVTAGIECG